MLFCISQLHTTTTTTMMALFPEALPQHVNTYSTNPSINIPFFPLTSHLLSLTHSRSNFSQGGSFFSPFFSLLLFLCESFRQKSDVSSETSNETKRDSGSFIK